jgi:1,4-dihydroxy-2-naphthoate octaprenyltransferase
MIENHLNNKNIIGNKMYSVFNTSLIYILGGGMAHYLGADLMFGRFLLGFIWILSIQLAGYTLNIYYRPEIIRAREGEILERLKIKPELLLPLASLFLISAAFVVLTFLVSHQFTSIIVILFIMTGAGLVIFALPPFKLGDKGYAEISLAIFQGVFVPALGFFILTNVYHRLLLFITFPITLIALASFLANNFSTYAQDLQIGRKSFIILLSWQIAVPIHHALLICAYLAFILGFAFGIPANLVWPTLFTVPIAGVELIWLQRIIKGGKPNWPLYRLLVSSLLSITIYLIAFTFWTR